MDWLSRPLAAIFAALVALFDHQYIVKKTGSIEDSTNTININKICSKEC